MIRLTITDRASYAISERTYTDEGFLRVPGRVARTGVQEYLASELGLTDRKPDDIIRVYRPPEEVFDTLSLDSYSGADVTIEHPDDMVNSENYKQHTVGTVRGAGTQDGDFVLCDLIIKDKAGIAAAESGKVQLSAGYTSMYDEAEENEEYDFIQRGIQVNHVALVDRARAGAQARLFDNKPEKRNMAKITLDSGRVVEVADEATAALVTDTVSRLTVQVSDALTKVEQLTASNDSLKEKLEEATKQSSDAAIAKRVAEIASTLDAARRIAGKNFTSDSVVVEEIQRAALAVKRANIDWASKAPAYVQAAFDMAAEEEATDEEKKAEDEEEEKSSTDSQYKQLAKDASSKQAAQIGEYRAKANDSMSQAWKATVGGDA